MNKISYREATWIIVRNKKWEILFLKRISNRLLTIPWWKKEANETSIECAYRELEEETGIKEISLELYTYTISFTNDIYWKETTYIWEVENDIKLINKESEIFSEMKFFNLNDLPDKKFIEKYDHIIIDQLKWLVARNLEHKI
jgi:8-oxo-dGTP pyrophosphatase MutT (NUDIX family)